MVRESIARHVRSTAAGNPGPGTRTWSREPGTGSLAFALLPLARGGDGDGACLIEPSVRCNHCGYCLSYGH